MSVHTMKSSKSYKLYIIAAVLMFIQTGVVAIIRDIIPVSGDYYTDWSLQSNMGMFLWLYPLIGVLFIVGAFFAKTGLGVTKVVERDIGGGWVERGVETANAVTCGCMTGLAVLITALAFGIPHVEWTMGLVIFGMIPVLLAGVIAIYAGWTSLSATMGSSGMTSTSSYSRKQSHKGKQPVSKTQPDSITCPYCSKTGISPHATACPNCGQPLE